MNISVDIEIESTVESVWKAVCDIENAQQMISAITALTILEEPDDEGSLVGLKWKETRTVFGKAADETMWITEHEPLKYYATRAENHGVVYRSTMSVEAIGEKTLLTLTFEGSANSFFVKIISTVMGFTFKRSMTKMLDKDLQDIKQFVEKTGDEVRRN